MFEYFVTLDKHDTLENRKLNAFPVCPLNFREILHEMKNIKNNHIGYKWNCESWCILCTFWLYLADNIYLQIISTFKSERKPGNIGK